MLRTADKRLFLGQQLSDLLGGQSAVTPPVAGYDGWWDAAHVDSLTIDSGAVSQWDDLSGSGFHLVQATVANKPAYDARTINGIVCPEFNGTTTFMTGNCPRDDRTATTFVVGLADVASGTRTMVGPNGTVGNHFRFSNDDLQTTTSASILAQMLNVLSAGVAFAAAQALTSTDITHYFDASSETDANAAAFTAGRTMHLGNNSVNGEYWDGLLAEIISYPVTLGASDVGLVLDYLSAKWGTP